MSVEVWPGNAIAKPTSWTYFWASSPGIASSSSNDWVVVGSFRTTIISWTSWPVFVRPSVVPVLISAGTFSNLKSTASTMMSADPDAAGEPDADAMGDSAGEPDGAADASTEGAALAAGAVLADGDAAEPPHAARAR